MSYRKLILLSQFTLLLVGAFYLGKYFKSFDAIKEKDGTISTVFDEIKTNRFSKVKAKLTVNKPNKTFKGYTLYSVSGTAEVLLFNMDGKIVHSWNVDAERARLLPNGNLLVLHGTKWGKDVEPWKSLRNKIREYDWNGNIVWEHTANDVAHHDLKRLKSGNTIFLRRTILPKEYKTKITDIKKRALDIRADSIIEINNKGQIQWKWHTYDHLDLNSCGRRECREIDVENARGKLKDWTHVNTVTIIPENKWFDQGDNRFKPGNIIFLPRNFWTVYIIDKESGKIVWEYGGDYKGGISGGHDAHMIPKGLPGAGNILILDNGAKVHRGQSFVLEVNPTNKKLEWVYDTGKKFFTGTRGSIQRLPNGNTLIVEDNTGRVFEVTRKKETVWELITDYQSSRAVRYPLSYCNKFKELS